ncbi:MAG: glycerol-3-phosphate 1-O-acyltransferase PlsY [Endomicrobia bacterium]|nr:glycerol-3-phosphate 1-O-acyltransferase PlsY [Endomicrobiia bacterium]MCL2507160.1 glycerol-3-phosphate 1-O-acyltransferase PlsY [Endomicrobiia bacterium]
MLVKILYLMFAYICGAIPFAYIVSKLFAGVDIRTVGSGNPGATNVFRAVGKTAGSITFILDMLKGFLPVMFAILIDDSFSYAIAVAAMAMLGHMFSVFLKFKGGKGVATGAGVFLALMPLPTLIILVVFVVVFVFSGYVALASVCAAVSLPLVSYFLGNHAIEQMLFTFSVASLVIYKHRTNLQRLRKGEEYKFKILGKK